MAKQFDLYIDTAVLTEIVVVNHNLGGYPIINMTKVDPISGDETYLSLYDPIIVSALIVDTNNIKVTFSGPFTGHLRAIVGDLDDLWQELVCIKNDINFIFKQLDLRAPSSRLSQLGTLVTQQMEALKNQIAAQATQLTTLTNRVNNL